MTTTVRVPADATAGDATIIARVGSDDITRVNIVIAASAGPATTVPVGPPVATPPAPRELAYTGASGRLTMLGAALVAVGLGLGRVRRRRTLSAVPTDS